VSGQELGLAVSVFLACTVEAVEALTIVVAVGATRSWSSALIGTGAAVLVLAVLVAGLGPTLTSLPIETLRLAVGGLLLVFGLQWLRKAILRAAGLKALRDEELAFARQTQAARAAGGAREGFDAYSFTISFKGVFLEGLEVAVIVLTFGANQHRVGVAAGAAAVAIAVVASAGVSGARSAGARAREHPQVRRRRDAELLRRLLGSGRCGRMVAGQRCRAAGDRARAGAAVAVLGGGRAPLV
jgi:uncharacterized membrane protein